MQIDAFGSDASLLLLVTRATIAVLGLRAVDGEKTKSMFVLVRSYNELL